MKDRMNCKKLMADINSGKIEMKINDQNTYPLKGIIKEAKNWIADGWGYAASESPSPAQIAAALLHEAADQFGSVSRGESDPHFPIALKMCAEMILTAYINDNRRGTPIAPYERLI